MRGKTESVDAVVQSMNVVIMNEFKRCLRTQLGCVLVEEIHVSKHAVLARHHINSSSHEAKRNRHHLHLPDC